MAKKEIKQTIRLAGEKEYSEAIRNAQRNLRTLRSELKAETAELGSNATAQQKNEARAKSLQKQIAEQEKVVETLKKALAEARKDYADNEDVVQKWEQKLNDARATLANLQNGLSETENAMRGASDATAEGVVATKSFADALDSISSAGESVSSAIEDIFTGMISTVRDVVVDLWDMIGETAAKANNWTDIAGYWNTSPENVEMWARAVEATGKSFSDFEAIVSRLNLGGKGKEITELLGVSDVNYEDQWAYAIAVMDQISELQKSGSLPENLWETLFGEKKAVKAMDMINGLDEIRSLLSTFNADEGGFGMGKDALETMNDLYVQIATIEQKWTALQDQFAAGLGTITADMLVNVSGSMDALNDFMNANTAEEREAALAKLRQNIEEFFHKVAEAIRAGLEVVGEVGKELQNSDDPIVSAMGNMMVQLTDALEWIVENQDAVKTAFETIFGVWFLAKLAAVSGKLASIIAQIETIKAFKGLSELGAAANGAGAASAAGAGEAAGAATGGSALGGLLGLGLIAGGFAWAAHERRTNPDIRGSEGAMERSSGGDEDLERAFIEYVEANRAVQERLDNGDIFGGEMEALVTQLNEAQKALEALPGYEDILRAYSDWRQGNSYGNADWVLPEGLFDMDRLVSETTGAVTDSVDKMLMNPQGSVGQAVTSDDMGVLRGLPGLLRQALFSRIDGLEVKMDGQKVAQIVAPGVSRIIAVEAEQ